MRSLKEDTDMQFELQLLNNSKKSEMTFLTSFDLL